MKWELAYVLGMGAVTPVGNSVPVMWERMIHGISGIGFNTFHSYLTVSRDRHGNPYDTSTNQDYFKNSIAAEVKDFSPEKFMDRKEVRRLDPFAQFAVAAAGQALAHAQLEITDEICDRVGVSMGTGNGGQITNEYCHDIMRREGPNRVSPLLIPTMMPNAVTAAVARQFGCRGPSSTLVSACASGADAIGNALEKIRHGKADVMIAGGSDAVITPLAFSGFANMHALLKNYAGDPRQSSRPFDCGREGFVMGEGAGVMVLASETFVRTHHLTPLVEVAGYGCSQDAHHLTAPGTDGIQAAKAVQQALRDANIVPSQIAYINAHGTSTLLNDKIETMALKLALGEKAARRIPISSSKSIFGHLIGAAGAVEAIVCAMTLLDRRAHATLNLHNIDPDCKGLDHIIGQPCAIGQGCALTTSFGFGGQNAALVFKPV